MPSARTSDKKLRALVEAVGESHHPSQRSWGNNCVCGAPSPCTAERMLDEFAPLLDRAVGAESRSAKLREALREAALLAHSFGGCVTDFAHCQKSTCARYRALDAERP